MRVRDEIESFRTTLMGRARSLRYLWDWPAELEVEDMVSAAMVRAIENAQSFTGTTRGELGAWLLQILNSEVIDSLRRVFAAKRGSGKVKSFEDFLADSQTRIEQFLEADLSAVSNELRRQEALQIVYAAIERLPERQRTALLLRFIRGKRIDEIAEQLSATNKAVTELIRRAIESLQRNLPKEN